MNTSGHIICIRFEVFTVVTRPRSELARNSSSELGRDFSSQLYIRSSLEVEWRPVSELDSLSYLEVDWRSSSELYVL
jgi:hypothetical protein